MTAASNLYDQIAATGKPLTAAERTRINETQKQISEQIENEFSPTTPQTLLDKTLAKIPNTVKIIMDLGDTIIALSRALLIALLPVVLVLALFVEKSRVQHGLSLFEVDENLAGAGAWLLVISNLLIEVTIQYIYQRENYKPPRAKRRSLRLVWQEWAYFLGLSRRWQAEIHSPAYSYEVVLRAITTAILFLAVGGSMSDVIKSVDGNFAQGIVTILTASSLHEFVVWISGLSFAYVVVKVAQSLTTYVSLRAVEYAGEIARRTGSKDMLAAAQTEARERIEREHLIAALQRRGVTTDNDDDDDFDTDMAVADDGNPAYANGRGKPPKRKKCSVCGETFSTRQPHITTCKRHR